MVTVDKIPEGIVIREAKFKGEEELLTWALRTVMHGMIFATRYPNDPSGSRLLVTGISIRNLKQ